MSICRTILTKWTCDSQSAREPKSNSDVEAYSPAEWARALNNPVAKGNLEDTVAAVEMQIIQSGAHNKLEENATSACNINNERAELLTADFTHTRTSSNASSVESSAAIPVPPRSVSRQSSVNCATSVPNDLTNGVTEVKEGESQSDWNALDGDCTLDEEPYFSPLKPLPQTCGRESTTGDRNIQETENKQDSSLSAIMTCPVSTSPNKQYKIDQSHGQNRVMASGLRSIASSGYISGGYTYSLSWKPRRPLMSPIPGDWFVGTHKSCPSLAYIVVDYSPQVGLRSREPSRIQKASGDDHTILPKSEGCLDTASAQYSDPGYHSRGEFNSMCRCKARCTCFPQSSRKDSIISATGDQSNRGRRVDQSSSVETCDASTSPHLPLQWFCPSRMARSMEDLQHNDINPVRVADKPSDKDHSQGPTQAEYEHDVYLACSTEDTSWGLKLLNILEEPPYNFRTYMYDRDCVLGRSTIDDRAYQIENSFKFICLLSPSFLRSGLCRKDLQLAQHEQTTNRPFSNFVIPLQIAQCNIPVALRNLQHCEAWTEGPSKCVVNRVVRAIRDST